MRARVPTAVLLACSAASACGQILNEIGSVVPGDIVAGDQFGNAVAVSGLHLVAGAFRDDDAGTNSGSAYVFDLGTGQQLYKLTASDAGELDSFGSSVSVHGEFAVVGACFAQHDGVVTGAAYVFDLADGAELRKLVAFDGEAYDRFGDAVSISSSFVVVGAVNDGMVGLPDSGSAYLFDRKSGQLRRKLLPAGADEFDLFGHAVAVTESHVLVGAPGDDDQGVITGAAYLFNALTGQQVMKLTPHDGLIGDGFGLEVAMSESFAVVAAVEHDAGAVDTGAVYVFDVNTGLLLHKLVADDAASGDLFGSSVAVSGDRVVVGAIRDDDLGSSSGSVYVFDAHSGEQLFKLLASDGQYGDWLGYSVGIDGVRVVTGAYDQVGGDGTGVVYHFELPGEVCLPDTNNDGMLSPADFSAWVAAFNAMAPECDQNDDGSCTPADFSAWVANYNAGC